VNQNVGRSDRAIDPTKTTAPLRRPDIGRRIIGKAINRRQRWERQSAWQTSRLSIDQAATVSAQIRHTPSSVRRIMRTTVKLPVVAPTDWIR
jgi:hypothetical protein